MLEAFSPDRLELSARAANDNLPPFRDLWVATHYACGLVRVGLEPHNWGIVLDCAPIFNRYRGKSADPLLMMSKWEVLPDAGRQD
jgi:hypothetical protein